jgi:hypothetical protein
VMCYGMNITMKQAGGVGLMVFAAVLLVWGLDATGSIQSGFSRFFRGVPSDSAGWLIAGSVGAGVMGLSLLFSSRTRAT